MNAEYADREEKSVLSAGIRVRIPESKIDLMPSKFSTRLFRLSRRIEGLFVFTVVLSLTLCSPLFTGVTTNRDSVETLVPIITSLTPTPRTSLAPTSNGDPVIAGAGDIACDPTTQKFNNGLGTATECRMKATADLLTQINPAAVLTMGDNQYEDGTLDKFQKSYEPTWGKFKAITFPATGNHEYHTAGAAGYFGYFGVAAGPADKGYYSFDLGVWHLIALNSNCAEIGGCQAGSPQELWLRADLAANPAKCTLAYWHHPLFSSGRHGNNRFMRAIWQALQDYQADVVLAGHDHLYERFGPQTATGVADPNGIREFIVGTGGRSLYAFNIIQPNSEVRNNENSGVIALTLHPSSYDWKFVPEPGTLRAFTDSGTADCR